MPSPNHVEADLIANPRPTLAAVAFEMVERPLRAEIRHWQRQRNRARGWLLGAVFMAVVGWGAAVWGWVR